MPIKNYSDTDKNFPDPIYGSGKDGNYTASSNFSLSRDMYWSNLIINSGVHIDTNGYKVFVRNNLKLLGLSEQDPTTSIGLINGASNVGTLFSGSTASATNSLGGDSASYSSVTVASLFGSASYFFRPEFAVDGYILNASQQTALALSGGSGDGVNPGGGVVVLSARRVSGNGTIYASGYGDDGFYSDTYTSSYLPGGTSDITGGGVIIYCSSKSLPSGIKLNVSGYTEGSALQFVV